MVTLARATETMNTPLVVVLSYSLLGVRARTSQRSLIECLDGSQSARNFPPERHLCSMSRPGASLVLVFETIRFIVGY
jgi:hypothetical protein